MTRTPRVDWGAYEMRQREAWQSARPATESFEPLHFKDRSRRS